MSFILDALKKSETDRQRQGGPALFEVKVAAPRSVLPAWAIAIAVLFAANLGVVLWLLLRHSSAPAAGTAPVPAEPAVLAGPPAPAPTPARAPTPAPAPTTAAAEEPSAPDEDNPPAVAGDAHTARSTAEHRVDAPGVAAAPARNGSGPSLNPDDYAPATDAPPDAGSPSGRVKRGTEAGVPLYQQVATTPGTRLPPLRLDLHAYADRPADRWVLINMHKVREGDSLPEGVHVDRITPSGAVLSYQGSQFLLTQ